MCLYQHPSSLSVGAKVAAVSERALGRGWGQGSLPGHADRQHPLHHQEEGAGSASAVTLWRNSRHIWPEFTPELNKQTWKKVKPNTNGEWERQVTELCYVPSLPGRGAFSLFLQWWTVTSHCSWIAKISILKCCSSIHFHLLQSKASLVPLSIP